MRLPLSRRLLGTGLASLALLAGCNQCTRLHPSCSQRPFDACGTIVPSPLPTQTSPVPANQSLPLRSLDGKPTMLPATIPAAQRSQSAEPPVMPELASASTEQKAAPSQPQPAHAREAGAKPTSAVEGTPAVPTPVLAVQPTAYAPPTASPAPATPRPRSHGDLSADPCFDHADDYTWLTGRLEYLYVRNIWRVRYAGCDEDDRFGGSLALTASFPVQEFQEGQLIHVEGRVLHGEACDHDGRPLYEVHAIRVLKKP
jgi:hypothetical protein